MWGKGISRALVAAAALALTACGHSWVSPPAAPIDFYEPPATVVTVKASGVDPQVLHLFDGRKVTFVNSDTRRHVFQSDTHPEHDMCGGAVEVALEPGEQREVVLDTSDWLCYYHDEEDPSFLPLRGAIIVHANGAQG